MARPVVLLLSVLLVSEAAAQNPRHIALPADTPNLRTLSQNWSDAEANWFYNAPQGSRLVPYDWLPALEQPDSRERFLEPNHIRRLGYVPRERSVDNPHGFPIGFIRDADYGDGVAAVGMTCAACHTGLVHFQGTAWLIDGGPTLGDMETFMQRLAAALQQTAGEDAKFARFAGALLGVNASQPEREALRTRVREIAAERAAYNARNLPAAGATPFGPGRIDAFGAIFNEVSATYLQLPENARPADAPVSYPCLWDAPQHDRVQWNGAAENRVSLLGRLLFGTTQVGALGRNSGEVLGVFGHAVVPQREPGLPEHYASTVNKENLLELEESLSRLWSPEWPAAFGEIDPERRDRGAELYQQNCIRCHALIDRDDEDRKVAAVLADVGTDGTMIQNFLQRQARTGRLEGRRQTLLKRERFGAEAPMAAILKHMVERVILLDFLPDNAGATLLADIPAELSEALNPGYASTAFVRINDQVLTVRLESLIHDAEGNIESLSGGEESVAEDVHDPLEKVIIARSVDVSSLKSIQSVLPEVQRLVVAVKGPDALESVPARTAGTATLTIGYKARPLNGVWATAPYLHNGSVPTLAELLTPPADRQAFHVGSREFDPAGVGYVSDPDFPRFDPSTRGNSNSGHAFGTNLTPEQKLDLIEYLKSL